MEKGSAKILLHCFFSDFRNIIGVIWRNIAYDDGE